MFLRRNKSMSCHPWCTQGPDFADPDMLEEVRRVLFALGLATYTDAFEANGYDDFTRSLSVPAILTI